MAQWFAAQPAASPAALTGQVSLTPVVRWHFKPELRSLLGARMKYFPNYHILRGCHRAFLLVILHEIREKSLQNVQKSEMLPLSSAKSWKKFHPWNTISAYQHF